MKKIFPTILIALSLLLGASNTTAKSDNASVGTKELLARIEALENLVGGGPDPSDIAGATFRSKVVFQVTTLANGLPVNLEINGMIAATRQWTFAEDGTGTFSTETCEGKRLTNFNGNLTIGNNGCINLPPTFTYLQTDNQVTVDFGDGPLELIISNDGQTIILNGVSQTSTVDGPNTFDHIANWIAVGVRTDN